MRGCVSSSEALGDLEWGMGRAPLLRMLVASLTPLRPHSQFETSAQTLRYMSGIEPSHKDS